MNAEREKPSLFNDIWIMHSIRLDYNCTENHFHRYQNIFRSSDWAMVSG